MHRHLAGHDSDVKRRARRALFGLVPAAALLWAVVAFALVPIVATLRLMVLNGQEGWADAADGLSSAAVAGIVMALPAALLSTAVAWKATRAFSTLRAGAALSNAVGLGGAVLGTLVAWMTGRWTAPRQIGVRASEWSAEQEWGPVAWVVYAVPWLLPLILGAIASSLLWSFLRAHSAERRGQTKAAEIRVHGARLSGTIVDVIPTDTRVDGERQFEVTVVYVSASGPAHATELLLAPADAAPARGGQVDVWYDPLGEEGVVLIDLTTRSTDHRSGPGLFPYDAAE